MNKAENTPKGLWYVSGRYKHVSCGDRRKNKQAEDREVACEWGAHTRIPGKVVFQQSFMSVEESSHRRNRKCKGLCDGSFYIEHLWHG